MKKKLIILGAATVLTAAVGINAYAHNRTQTPVHVRRAVVECQTGAECPVVAECLTVAECQITEECNSYIDDNHDGICDNGDDHSHSRSHVNRHNGGGHRRGHGRGHH